MKGKKKSVRWFVTGLLTLLGIWLLSQAFILQAALAEAEERLAGYEPKTEVLQSFGQISYVDRGEGPVILVSHGISGGYDQAYDAVAGMENRYRLIAPSRFGYPGSPLPDMPSVQAQATAFAELLDTLGIDQAYILGTCAGGTPAIRFALDYPERCKGLILYSSAMPETGPPQSVEPWQGPPAFTFNNFVMWTFRGLFSPVMGMDPDTVKTMLPMDQRSDGMRLDAEITNPDMARQYADYPVEQITCPVLMIGARDDRLVDADAMEKAAQRFQNHELLLFEDGGHLMVGHEQEVEDALDRFIRNTETGIR